MAYTVLLTKAAAKALAAVPEPFRRRMRDAIDTLAENPRVHGAKKLSGSAEDYSLRVHPYRAIYTIDDASQRVIVHAVGHRREVYR